MESEAEEETTMAETTMAETKESNEESEESEEETEESEESEESEEESDEKPIESRVIPGRRRLRRAIPQSEEAVHRHELSVREAKYELRSMIQSARQSVLEEECKHRPREQVLSELRRSRSKNKREHQYRVILINGRKWAHGGYQYQCVMKQGHHEYEGYMMRSEFHPKDVHLYQDVDRKIGYLADVGTSSFDIQRGNWTLEQVRQILKEANFAKHR